MERSFVAQFLPGQNKASEVHVGQKRRDNAALRRPSPRVFGGSRPRHAASPCSFLHRCLEPPRYHREHLPVGYSAAEAFHQCAMWHGVEVVAQVSVHYFLTAFLPDLIIDQPNRRLGVPSRSESHLLFAEVCFENRAEHHHQSHLSNSIPHGRYPERPLSSVTFGYPYS